MRKGLITVSYLSYDEYKTMGGELEESAFSSLLFDVESKVNYLTNGRIAKLETIPQAVKTLIFKLICFYNTNSQGVTENTNVGNLTSYSNGIESFGYATNGDNSFKGSTSFDNKILSIMKEYLWEYPDLLYRGRQQWNQK